MKSITFALLYIGLTAMMMLVPTVSVGYTLDKPWTENAPLWLTFGMFYSVIVILVCRLGIKNE